MNNRCKYAFTSFVSLTLFAPPLSAAAPNNSIVSKDAEVDGIKTDHPHRRSAALRQLSYGHPQHRWMWRPIMPRLAGAIYGHRTRSARYRILWQFRRGEWI